MPSMFNEIHTVSMTLLKETKNKVVYAREGNAIDTLYIAKSAFGDHGYPDVIIVEIKVPA